MKGIKTLVISSGLMGVLLVNQASADLMDFLYKKEVSIQAHSYSKPSKVTTTVFDNSRLRIVKIGSHVLRNQLIEAGCVQANQSDFIKCRQDVLERELESFSPVR